MNSVDFNITLCTGGQTDELVPDCPRKNECKRYWTQEHTNAAREQELVEHSIYVLVDPNSITEKGCEYFLEK